MSTLDSHAHDLQPFRHSHAFADQDQARRERALTWVTLLTLATMVVELAVIAGRAGRGFLVTYAVTDERDSDMRPNMGATWGMDRTQALLDAGRSAGAGIRSRSSGY